jgi:hypothetical protein
MLEALRAVEHYWKKGECVRFGGNTCYFPVGSFHSSIHPHSEAHLAALFDAVLLFGFVFFYILLESIACCHRRLLRCSLGALVGDIVIGLFDGGRLDDVL